MIDILLATHNSEKYIRELLDSLLCQTVQDFQILAGDDGSSDTTVDILRKYANTHENITVLPDVHPTGSAKMNFFRLLGHTTSEYVMFADHDDVWKNTKIEKTLLQMKNLEECCGIEKPLLVHTDLAVVDQNLQPVSPSLMQMQNLAPDKKLNKLLAQNNVTGCTVMVNRVLAKKLRYTNPSDIIMHDWWLALIASAFGGIAYLPEQTILYRQHTQNEVGAKDVNSKEYIANRLKNTGGVKENLLKTYTQAGEFYRTYGNELTDGLSQMVLAYAEFGQIAKSEKWRRLKKYDFYKNGIIRKIGQFLLG